MPWSAGPSSAPPPAMPSASNRTPGAAPSAHSAREPGAAGARRHAARAPHPVRAGAGRDGGTLDRPRLVHRRSALRPLHAMTAAARQISAASLRMRMRLTGPHGELKELGDTFDELLPRLEASFNAQGPVIANAHSAQRLNGY